MDIWQYLEVVF